MRRRDVLATLVAGAAGACLPRPSGRRPRCDLVQSGDAAGGEALVWGRADRPGQMLIEWATRARPRDWHRVTGPWVDGSTDLTGRAWIRDLPRGQTIVYRVRFADDAGVGEPTPGSLRIPGPDRDLVVLWSGDVCGQGWGIDPARGGLRAFAALAQREPHLFIHSGDAIYADNGIPAELPVAGGPVWRNVVTPAKSRPAESIDDFRGNYAYNFLDRHYRAFTSQVAMIAQWDDHETRNNWYPGEIFDADYRDKRAEVVAARARRAFQEWMPVPDGPIHRQVTVDPDLDVFVLDLRSFRDPNPVAAGDAPAAGLGAAQCAWLGKALAGSKARWKIVACDQPIGLIIPSRDVFQEGIANGRAGAPGGREHELAELLRFVRSADVRNVVWVTADVHYAAAHRYDPSRATLGDFAPFWELVAGPLHAGSFGPNPLDPTFGPEVVFQRPPPPPLVGAGPWAGYQSFGALRVDRKSGALIASLHDDAGSQLWDVEIAPA